MLSFKQYLQEKIFYRGLTQPEDENYSSFIDWFSEDEELAKMYSGETEQSTIIKKDLSDDVVERTFEHGFRTAFTEVKAEDFVERIVRGINDAYRSKWINEEEGRKAFDELHSLELPKGYKRIFDWWNTYKPFIDILKMAGYKSIHNVEQNKNTYGVFK